MSNLRQDGAMCPECGAYAVRERRQYVQDNALGQAFPRGEVVTEWICGACDTPHGQAFEPRYRGDDTPES